MKKGYTAVIILALLALLLAISCSPQKRLNRLIKKHPELSIENKVIVTDTLYLPSTSIDTIFSTDVDTLVMVDSLVKVTYIRVKDKIYLKGETMRYPVIVTKEVKVKSPVVTKTIMKEHWYIKPLVWWFIITLAILLIALFIKSFKAYLSKLPL